MNNFYQQRNRSRIKQLERWFKRSKVFTLIGTMTSKLKKHRTIESEPNSLQRFLPAWILLLIVGAILMPTIIDFTVESTVQVVRFIPTVIRQIIPPAQSEIAPLFTPTVQHWSSDIARWAEQYDLDPNLIATVMQIESCGHPTVASYAGAQGLFQVMPFHFDEGEDYLDPDTNALRSANFLHVCDAYANGDVGLTLACYNGGPSVTAKAYSAWPEQTQRYYDWGLGIYNDARVMSATSQVLDRWLNAGGVNLCNSAQDVLYLN